MKGGAVPSNKPRFEGLLPEDLAKKAEHFLQEKDISRSKLVQYAIALYIDTSKVHIALGKAEREEIKKLAEKNCRPFEFEMQFAIQKYIEENKEKG